MTFSYLCSLLLIRIAVLISGAANTDAAQAAAQGLRPAENFALGANIILFGHHIHHFYFGLMLLIASGGVSIIGGERVKRETLAILFGVGLGLLMDEIGLLLTWGDYYSRATYLLSLLVLALFLNVIFFGDFWREVRAEISEGRGLAPLSRFVLGMPLLMAIGENLNKTTTKRLALLFAAFVYLGVGILILVKPNLLYYWIAGAFLLHGVSLLVRAWSA